MAPAEVGNFVHELHALTTCKRGLESRQAQGLESLLRHQAAAGDRLNATDALVVWHAALGRNRHVWVLLVATWGPLRNPHQNDAAWLRRRGRFPWVLLLLRRRLPAKEEVQEAAALGPGLVLTSCCCLTQPVGLALVSTPSAARWDRNWLCMTFPAPEG